MAASPSAEDNRRVLIVLPNLNPGGAERLNLDLVVPLRNHGIDADIFCLVDTGILSEEAEVLYKCTTLWDAASDRSILWNDPEIGVDWGLANAQVSPKDAEGRLLREAEVFESLPHEP